MAGRFLFALVAVQWLAASSFAFSARSVSKHLPASSRTVLKSSMTSLSEQEAQYMMAKARECAFSDTCSIEESREHLHDVLNIQVACASGAVVGHDVCDDQQEAAEIVSRLRNNIENGPHGLTTRQQTFAAGMGVPLTFLFLACLSMLLSVNANPDVAPFTLQEVAWATRDGYLDDLVLHFLKNGGLVVSDSDVIPLQFQEVMWSIRDGYFDDLVSHFMRNGGL